MSILETPPLKKGDTITVISPADSFQPIESIGLVATTRMEEELGVILTYSKHCSADADSMKSSSVSVRIEDLHSAFQDKSINAIIAATGGYNSNELLPYIDWGIIKRNPKPFIGSSDMTVLLNAIYAKTGVTTYHGPNFYRFGMKHGLEYTIEYFKKELFSSDSYIIPSSSSWSDDKWWRDQENRIFHINPGHNVCNQGEAQGVIIGGNLCSLNLLQGTEYMPSIQDSILFLEDDDLAGDMTFSEFNRNLNSLLQLPYADTVRGVLFGRFKLTSDMTVEKIQYIVQRNPILRNIPVIANVDFGHTDPCITFPVGGTIMIKAMKGGSTIEVVKS